MPQDYSYRVPIELLIEQERRRQEELERHSEEARRLPLYLPVYDKRSMPEKPPAPHERIIRMYGF